MKGAFEGDGRVAEMSSCMAVAQFEDAASVAVSAAPTINETRAVLQRGSSRLCRVP